MTMADPAVSYFLGFKVAAWLVLSAAIIASAVFVRAEYRNAPARSWLSLLALGGAIGAYLVSARWLNSSLFFEALLYISVIAITVTIISMSYAAEVAARFGTES